MKIINLKNMMKKFIAIMLGVAVFFTAIPAFALQAETTTTSPGLTVTSATVTAGNSVSVYVNAQNWENIAGLNFAIYYDSSAFKLSNTYNGSLMGSTVADVNKNTEGVVTTSFLSVDGISGSGQVMRIVFTTLSTAKAGDYDLELVVSEAYNTNFEDVTISKTSGKITINEKTVTEGTATFLAVPSTTALETAEVFTYQIKSSSIGKLAGGDYEIRYDAEYLEVVDVTLGTPFTTATAVTSIKQDAAGYIKVSHADIQAIRASYGTVLFTVTFKTKDIGVSSTSIDFSTTGLTDEGLNSMSSSAIKKTISIKEREQEVIYPAFQMIWDGVTHEDRTVRVDVVLPGEAMISAGDFVISYETNKMVCVKAETDSALSSAGGLLITKEDIGNGNISFSYVNTNPTNVDTVVLHLAFEIEDGYFGSTRLVAIGKDVVNASFEDVTLSFPKTTMYFNSIEGCNIPYLLNHYGYTGNEICPEIYINGLIQGRDYEVTYENNINVGTATITITGLGNYTGSIVKTFEIKMPVDINTISDERIGGIETSYVYTGKEITPKVTIEGMEENQDYIVGYVNNKNVGTATVTISGIGCYCGSITKTFQIEQLLIHTIPEDSIHGLEQSFIYTGKEIEPIVSIDGFAKGVDFELSYENNINAGTAMVIISGINNCKGSVSLEFDIVQAEQEIQVQDYWEIGMDVEEFALDATIMQEESVILYKSNNPDILDVNDDGIVTVRGIGTATIVLSVEETANYKGTSRVVTVIVKPEYTIDLVRDGHNLDILIPGEALITSGTFTFTYDTNSFVFLDIDVLGVLSSTAHVNFLEDESQEGIIRFSYNNTNPTVEDDLVVRITYYTLYDMSSTTSVQITGEEVIRLNEDIELKYTSLELSLADLSSWGIMVEGLQESYVYEGKEIKPSFLFQGISAEELDEYDIAEVKYSNNINVGTATITVNFLNIFSGSFKKTFEIVPAELGTMINQDAITGLADKYVYTGIEIIPKLEIQGLVLGVDYELSYVNNINAGIATVIISGIGNYTGTIERTFEIQGAPVESAFADKIQLSQQSYEYTGQEIKPLILIDGYVEGIDYEVSYKNNIEMGTAMVTIVGIGNYSGAITRTFKITAARGDVNQDKMLTTDDAIYLLNHVMSPDKYLIEQDGDMDGNGVVNSDDAIYLLYHVMFGGKYPLS